MTRLWARCYEFTLKMEKSTNSRGEEIVVFGWGEQGRAQSLNLRDSGLAVSVYLRKGSPRAAEAGGSNILLLTDPAAAAARAAIAALLIPDREQPAFYKEALEKGLPKNAALIFAHGFAIHYSLLVPRPDLDVVLVAPLGHASAVRGDFMNGSGVPCVIAVAQDATGRAKERAMAYAKGISRGGTFIDSTFAEEVESDLFAEQAVLCGGVPELARAAFETLVDSGINPDIAYFCCLRELKAIVDLLFHHSIAGMRGMISDTARYGAITRGPRVIGEEARRELKRIMEEIRSGAFAREIADRATVEAIEKKAAREDREHPIERIHEKYY
ncbi:MAG: ketol-acid reductoisomerase [Pseudomonadota bacterium]